MTTVTEFVVNDMMAEANKAEAGMFVSPMADDHFYVFFHSRKGTEGMKVTGEVKLDRAMGLVGVRFWVGDVNPTNGMTKVKNKDKKVEPTKASVLGMHELCGEKWLAAKEWLREQMAPVQVEVERNGVEVPAELLEQLVSSDGTVLAEKENGKWNDVA